MSVSSIHKSRLSSPAPVTRHCFWENLRIPNHCDHCMFNKIRKESGNLFRCPGNRLIYSRKKCVSQTKRGHRENFFPKPDLRHSPPSLGRWRLRVHLPSSSLSLSHQWQVMCWGMQLVYPRGSFFVRRRLLHGNRLSDCRSLNCVRAAGSKISLPRTKGMATVAWRPAFPQSLQGIRCESYCLRARHSLFVSCCLLSGQVKNKERGRKAVTSQPSSDIVRDSPQSLSQLLKIVSIIVGIIIKTPATALSRSLFSVCCRQSDVIRQTTDNS